MKLWLIIWSNMVYFVSIWPIANHLRPARGLASMIYYISTQSTILCQCLLDLYQSKHWYSDFWVLKWSAHVITWYLVDIDALITNIYTSPTKFICFFICNFLRIISMEIDFVCLTSDSSTTIFRKSLRYCLFTK